ncbi:MAG: guanylate kinase [Desulfurivibrio sp.]|nr:MAG: guanylate kinase [Desulfurivibrio sp.]
MRGNLIIISAPSGTGKTTILKRLFTLVKGVTFSVSHTTRSPRSGEQHGVDYYFVDQQTFLGMRTGNEFLEWAEVHGNYYGTSRAEVNRHLARGLDVLLDIDVQGARQVRQTAGGDCFSIFIAPPSWEELTLRLTGRGTDSPETIRLRLDNAIKEMQDAGLYDYLIVNDTVDQAVDTLRSIIIAQRCRARRNSDGLPLLLPDCEHRPL